MNNLLLKTRILIKSAVNKSLLSRNKINRATADQVHLSYDSSSNSFIIKSPDLTWPEKTGLRKYLYNQLIHITPTHKLTVDDIVSGYYDRCLERYLFERLDRETPIQDTCWYKIAQNNKCIGWLPPDAPFSDSDKAAYLKERAKKKEYYGDPALVTKLHRDNNGFLFLLSENVYTNECKTLQLYHSLKNNGFSDIINRASPIILGFSEQTNLHNVIAGRHRIAVLKYLRSKNLISNIRVSCHLVKYPFEQLVYTRPYTALCINCSWSETFDPGAGTHQNFTFRDGIAKLRGKQNAKGGTQKWSVIASVFEEMVKNKTVCDIGSHRGLYVLRALEYGAKSSLAFEISEDLINITNKIKSNYYLYDLHTYQGDFFSQKDFSYLKNFNIDTLFIFGIYHHLLRIGFENKALSEADELIKSLSSLVNHGMLIEFAKPTEETLDKKSLQAFSRQFELETFESALTRHFSHWKNLGKCHYKSGNSEGRFMYLATNPKHD